jgi:hypothetical protein
MALSTMCGHGMISHSMAKKIDFVKETVARQSRRATSRGSALVVFQPFARSSSPEGLTAKDGGVCGCPCCPLCSQLMAFACGWSRSEFQNLDR